MDFLADFGAAKSARLDAYAKLAGFPGKVGIDGSQVAPMVHSGRLDEVNAYCLCDVAQTAGIFLRVELLRGVYDRPRYQTLAKGLLTFFDSDARLTPIMELANRRRFVLEESDEELGPAMVAG
jgi:predicted PolB exonuclease-like 3'-5' exonuclease